MPIRPRIREASRLPPAVSSCMPMFHNFERAGNRQEESLEGGVRPLPYPVTAPFSAIAAPLGGTVGKMGHASYATELDFHPFLLLLVAGFAGMLIAKQIDITQKSSSIVVAPSD